MDVTIVGGTDEQTNKRTRKDRATQPINGPWIAEMSNSHYYLFKGNQDLTMIIDHYQPSLTLLRLSANIYLQTFAMWQGLLIRASTPIVRMPLRSLAFTSIRSKGDEKVNVHYL